jgi:hypothetical protein
MSSGSLPPPLDAIREKLRGHPELTAVETPDTITVLASTPDGFDVSLHCGDGEYVVSMAGWHTHFHAGETDRALDCFAFGLSDAARLRVSRRGGRDYRWAMEALTDGVWREDSVTGLLFFPFWRRKTVRYLRNTAITSKRR